MFALLIVSGIVACGGDDDDDSDDDAGDDDAASYSYAVIDTDQTKCYGEDSEIDCGSAFSGQDAQYGGYQPAYQDNGDGTVTDLVTGLMWQQDPGDKMTYDEAAAGAADFDLAGHDDWRLPNAKELQSIVDYSRSPDATNSAAIDPVFEASPITNEAGDADYAFYWTGTTHASSNGTGGSAVYVSFGRAMGYMNGQWIDVHGAGAQRSDPKNGDPADYPDGHGPQGDAIRIFNHVRCVRDGAASPGDDDATDDDAADDDADDSGDDTGPPPPPDEAIEACDGKAEGDDCSFESPDGTVTGTCEMIGDVLACVPGDGPPSLPAE